MRPSKARQAAFRKAVDKLLRQRGANVQPYPGGTDYILYAPRGRVTFTMHNSAVSNPSCLYTVFGQWEDPAVAGALGGNAYSGKWNFHAVDTGDWGPAAETFRRDLDWAGV